jgi:flagellar biosynthesis/type III secretory pathway protein FliH
MTDLERLSECVAEVLGRVDSPFGSVELAQRVEAAIRELAATREQLAAAKLEGLRMAANQKREGRLEGLRAALAEAGTGIYRSDTVAVEVQESIRVLIAQEIAQEESDVFVLPTE